MFIGLSHKYKYRAIAKKLSVVMHRYWHWRRAVSVMVLVTFLSSLMTPVLASNSPVDNKPTVNKNNITNNKDSAASIAIDIKSNKAKRGKNNFYHLAPTLIQSKANKSETDKTFSPQFDQSQNQLFSPQNKYQPYFEIGGAKYFNQASRAAGIYDLFIPLLQSDDRLLFVDLRIFDRTGSASEGNLHLGFRKLYPDTKQMIGIYGSFDRKRSDKGNDFDQLTVGVEYWNNRCFVGGNIYKPIGITSKYLGKIQTAELMPTGRNIGKIKTTTNTYYDKALPGVDAELGYAITDNLTSYAGGYYFNTKDADPIAGPKIRLTYDYQKPVGHILGVLDGVSVEVGVQHDAARGNSAYLGIKFKVGLTNFKKNSNLPGFERHMVELVRRDPDIVVGKAKTVKVELSNQQGYVSDTSNDGDGGGGDGSNNQKQESPNKDFDFDKLKNEKNFSDWTAEELAAYKEILAKRLGLPSGLSWKDIHDKSIKFFKTYHPDKTNNDFDKHNVYMEKKDLYFDLQSISNAALKKEKPNTSDNNHDNQYGADTKATSDYNNHNTQSNANIDKQVYALCDSQNKDEAQLNYEVSENVIKTFSEERLKNNASQFKEDNKQSNVVLPSLLSEFLITAPRENINLQDRKIGDVIASYESFVKELPEINKASFNVSILQKTKQMESEIELSKSGCSTLTCTAITLVDTPIKWLDYVVDGFFKILIPIRGANALEINVSEIENLIKVLDPELKLRHVANKSYTIDDLLGVLNSIDSNSIELTEVQINGLEQVIRECGAEYNIQIFKVIAKILTNSVTHYAKDPSHIAFLVDLAKSETTEYAIGETIINKFARDVNSAKVWRDNKVLYSFASLLSKDTSSHVLANALIYANKFYGYMADIEALPYFEKLLGDIEFKKLVLVLITTSLEKLLLSYDSNTNLAELEKHVDNLQGKIGKFSPGLVNAIFEVYRQDQSYFSNIIVDRLAEDKHLSFDLLSKFAKSVIDPSVKIKDIKAALFIAQRLVQNYIILSAESLRYFIKYLFSEDESIRLLAINLYYQLNKETPEAVTPELCDALIATLPKFGALSRSRIENILNGAKLSEEQKSRYEIQKKDNEISEEKLSQALWPFRELLKDLIANIKERSELSMSDQDELERSAWRLLNDVNWPADFLFSLLNKARHTNDLSLVVAALEKLNDYTVSPDAIDRDGLTALATLDKTPPKDMLSAIKRLMGDNSFFVEENIDSLIKKFREQNKNNPEMLALVENNYFKDQLLKINEIMKQPGGLRGITKLLPEWTQENCKMWLKTIANTGILTVNDDNIAEVIAVVEQAVHVTIFENEYYPRQVQLLVVLSLLKSLSSEGAKGILEQVATGEGKSIIIAMFAAIVAMQGGQIDIVTSSYGLAQRDVLKHEKFYKVFDLTATHNTKDEKGMKVKDCYLSQIVYGDVLNFNADALKDASANVRLGRAFYLVIVDEEDLILLDQYNMKALLSSAIPGFDILGYLLVYIWGTAKTLRSMLHEEKDGCHLKLSASTGKEEEGLKKIILPTMKGNETNPLDFVVGTNCIDYFKSAITTFTKDKLFAFGHMPEAREFIVPKNWEKFAEYQLTNWVQSLLLSYQYIERVDYILVRKTEDSFERVTLVDKRGGVILHDLSLSDGLHQFIGLENKLAIHPESVVSTFMSYPGYFKQYKWIVGLSGTLGITEFFEKVYGVRFGIIPPFVPKNFVEFPPILVTNDMVLSTILDIFRRKIKGKRACLIVMKTINQVESAYKYLSSQAENADEASRIFVYGTGDEENDKKLVERKLQPGDCIIATYLAGRGTDLKLSKEVIDNGGLHVLEVTPADNWRQECQIKERGARRGDPGSAQIIIIIEDALRRFKIDCTGLRAEDCLAKIYEVRDKNEKQELKRYVAKDLPYIEIQDNLHVSFSEFINKLDAPTGYQISIGRPENSKESKHLYLYKDDAKIKLQVFNGREIEDVVKEILDITELIRGIDPRAAKHIEVLLSTSGAIPSLSKQDRELIYFIASKNGYPKISEIYGRVWNEFNMAAEKEGGKQEYLKALLANDLKFKDLRSLSKIETRKLFLFWLEDRELYNEKFMIQELNEKFGIWLRQQECLFYYNNLEDKQLEETIRSCREQSNNNFLEFKKSILEQLEKNEFVHNPTYSALDAFNKLKIYYTKLQKSNYKYKNKDLLEKVAGTLESATNLEPTYTWVVPNAMVSVILAKEGDIFTYSENDENGNLAKAADVKGGCAKHTNRAIQMLYKRAETASEVFSFALANGNADLTDAFAVQQLLYSEVCKKLATTLQNNLEVIAKASSTQMVRGKKVEDVGQATKDINVKDILLQQINKSSGMSSAALGTLQHIAETFDFASLQKPILDQILNQILAEGGFVVELETYELEKQSKDWTGTIVSALAGIAFICIGFALATISVGVLLQSFAISLISKGVGDIIQSIVSTATGKPIDLGDYLNSTAMSIGISLAVAGVLYFVDRLAQGLDIAERISEVAKSLKNAKMAFAGKDFLLQATTGTLGTLLGKLGDKFVDEKDIQAETQKAVDDLVNYFNGVLKNIFATDIFNGRFSAGSVNLTTSLYNLINKVVHDCERWLHDPVTTFGVGIVENVAGNIAGKIGKVGEITGWGNLIKTGTNVAMGSVKNFKALGKMIDGIKAAIQEVVGMVPKSGKMMTDMLASANVFGNDIGDKLAVALNSQGYILNGEINGECSNLNNVQLNETLSSYKPGIVEACESVKKLLFADEYTTQYDVLKNYIIDHIANAISSIQKNEIVQPVANGAALEAAEVAVKRGLEFYGYIMNKVDETRAAREKADYAKYMKKSPYEEAFNDAWEQKGKDEASNKNQQKSTEEQSRGNAGHKNSPNDSERSSKSVNAFNSFLNDIQDKWLRSENFCPKDLDRSSAEPRKPTIELVVREVFHHTGFMHGFTIFTDSKGQKTIIAGYPEGHNAMLNLQIVDAPYIEANAKLLDKDWAKRGNYGKDYRIIKTEILGSDQDLQDYLSKAREAVEVIKQSAIKAGNNEGRFDYDLCITDRCWGSNSNTVQRAVWDGMGMKIEVPRDIKMPGIEGKFYKGPMDDVLQKVGDAIQEN
ncbi:Protein translocase subunit SecA (modular protein) [Gammaproteobacteria bacterium]